ncbi:MAG TPA: hypothetical protein VKB88_17850 [Bryobacteraceae bacterium]|nr:hypothetical protein [Bryobacteraceae bacterium]
MFSRDGRSGLGSRAPPAQGTHLKQRDEVLDDRVWREFDSDSLAWLDAKVENSNTTQIPEQNLSMAKSPGWQKEHSTNPLILNVKFPTSTGLQILAH